MLAKLKNSYKSVVVWFNGMGLSLLYFWDQIHDSLPELQQYVPDNVYKKIGLTLLIGNLVLRFKTGKPLEEK